MSPVSLAQSRLEHLLDITRELSATISLEQLLHKITQAAAELTETERACILLFDESSGELRFMAATPMEELHGIPVPIESSLAGAAFTSRAPVMVPVVELDPRYYGQVDIATGAETHSLLVVPLQFQERCIGAVEVINKLNGLTFDQQDTDTLLVLAAQAAIAIQNAQLYQQAQRRAEQLATMNEIGRAVSTLRDLDDVLETIRQLVQRSLPLDCFGVGLYDAASDQIAFTQVYDGGERWDESAARPLIESSFSYDVIRSGRPLRVNRMGAEPAIYPYNLIGNKSRFVAAALFAPLPAGDQIIGMMSAQSYTPDVYTDDDLDLLVGIAYQAAIAIQNAHLYSAAQREIAERARAEAEVRRHRDHLEDLVEERVAEIKHINAELQQQNAELDAFAHTVAHDLKNPLGPLMGFAHILLEELQDTPNEVAQDCATHLLASSRKMARIIDELLLLASVRRQDEVRLEQLDMAVIVQEVQERLDYLVQQHGAEISVPLTWPSAVGHAAWIEEVWANYLSNAIKYGGRPPRLELGATVLEQEGMVRFWVRDNGVGLAPDDQARLFTEFTQLHQLRAQGHGLGLSIVRRIIERLGGQVGVESAPDHGSVFFFTLPLVTAESSIATPNALP